MRSGSSPQRAGLRSWPASGPADPPGGQYGQAEQQGQALGQGPARGRGGQPARQRRRDTADDQRGIGAVHEDISPGAVARDEQRVDQVRPPGEQRAQRQDAQARRGRHIRRPEQPEQQRRGRDHHQHRGHHQPVDPPDGLAQLAAERHPRPGRLGKQHLRDRGWDEVEEAGDQEGDREPGRLRRAPDDEHLHRDNADGHDAHDGGQVVARGHGQIVGQRTERAEPDPPAAQPQAQRQAAERGGQYQPEPVGDQQPGGPERGQQDQGRHLDQAAQHVLDQHNMTGPDADQAGVQRAAHRGEHHQRGEQERHPAMLLKVQRGRQQRPDEHDGEQAQRGADGGDGRYRHGHQLTRVHRPGDAADGGIRQAQRGDGRE